MAEMVTESVTEGTAARITVTFTDATGMPNNPPGGVDVTWWYPGATPTTWVAGTNDEITAEDNGAYRIVLATATLPAPCALVGYWRGKAATGEVRVSVPFCVEVTPLPVS